MEITEGFEKANSTIKKWLEKKVKDNLNIDINLNSEIIIHNFDGNNSIKIIKVYTEQITEIEYLESLMDRLIDSILIGKVTLQQMQSELEM